MGSKYIVYALICPKCGCPRYVGKSTSGLSRIAHHRTPDKHPQDASHHKKAWVRDLIAQGLMFDVRVLLELPDANHLDAAEVYWIAEMRRRSLPLTNFTDGGGGTNGWKQSPETIEKRRQKLLGRPVSKETKAKIAASLTGRPSPKKGRPLTAEEKIKHAAARVVPPFQDQHGRVYKTIKEASERWGIPPGNIVHCLKGRRKSAGGLEFKYVPKSNT